MSNLNSNNFIAIVKRSNNEFIGYDCSASLDYCSVKDYVSNGKRVFKARTKQEAIEFAYNVDFCEFGFFFVNKRGKQIK